MMQRIFWLTVLGLCVSVTVYAAEQQLTFETPESLALNPNVVKLADRNIPQSTLALVTQVHETVHGKQNVGQITKQDITKKIMIGGRAIAFLTFVGEPSLYPQKIETRWYHCGVEVAKYPLTLKPQGNPHRVWFWVDTMDLGSGAAAVEVRSADDQVLAQLPFEVLNSVGESVTCPPAVQRFTFSTDAWFGYGRFSLPDLSMQGRQELNALVAQLKSGYEKINTITVTGHTDIIGPDASNERLSKGRANSVRQLLVSEGIEEAIITTEGKGKFEPVVECANTLTREQLIECAKPNRRVTIDISGLKRAQPTQAQ